MHVILGAGGAISDSLCTVLQSAGVPLALVSRRASPSAFGRSVSADLLQAGALHAVLEHAETAYLLAGLPYKLSVWQQQWPALVRNVIESCTRTGTKLVFLDNIYMLSDESMPHMTESSPMTPSSGKGKVRANIRSRMCPISGARWPCLDLPTLPGGRSGMFPLRRQKPSRKSSPW